MNGILFCSFYTDDDYYKSKKDELVNKLIELEVDYSIELLEIPPGMVWSDICRKKISFIARVCDENPRKKIIWIDVDCLINRIPDYLANFSADIIGFARGFTSPMKLGYHLRSRFWEPCLIGINCTTNGRNFIKYAAMLETEFVGAATDDYFFEESWRENCANLSFQIIPSQERVTPNLETGFFEFGSSGKVEEFSGQVIQHYKIRTNTLGRSTNRWYSPRRIIKTILARIGLFEQAKSFYWRFKKRNLDTKKVTKLSKKDFKMRALNSAFTGSLENLNLLRTADIKFLISDKENILRQADAIMEYKTYNPQKSNIPLCWWFNPEPGNLGDWLSPYIFTKISGQGVDLISPAKMNSYSTKNWLSVGSIAKFANSNSIVIGSGISRKNTDLNPDATYLSLRGPLTGEVLEASGGVDPKIYGDPAIVMPRIYQSSRNSNGRGLLVRHFSHLEVNVRLTDKIDESSIFASSFEDIEGFIDTIHKYEFVLTSAMHCYILCQAYGIPVGLVVWKGVENNVAGDGIKYVDYALGAGVNPVSPMVISHDLEHVDISTVIQNESIDSDFIDILYSFLEGKLKSELVSSDTK